MHKIQYIIKTNKWIKKNTCHIEESGSTAKDKKIRCTLFN